jgi:hypothetical protein
MLCSFCGFLNKSLRHFFNFLKSVCFQYTIKKFLYILKTGIFRHLSGRGRFFLNWPNLAEFAEKLWKNLATVLVTAWVSRQTWDQGPHLRTPNPGFNPGFTPPYLLYKRGGKPRVEPGAWRSEMWAQYYTVQYTVPVHGWGSWPRVGVCWEHFSYYMLLIIWCVDY